MATRKLEDEYLEMGDHDILEDEQHAHDLSNMTLAEHLEELRRRIVKSLIAVAIFSVMAFIFRVQMLDFLAGPLPFTANAIGSGKTKLVVTGLGEGFTTTLFLALAGGCVMALPVVLYQTWAFIGPGLYQREKKYAVPFIVLGLFLFLAGLALGYVVLRYPVNWLVNFASDSFTELISASSYFKFVALFLLIFGAVFEVPLILTFLALLEAITAESLCRKRAAFHVSMWIAATLLTPGADLYSPIFLGVAMSGLFELSIIFIKASQHMREHDTR